MLMNTSLAQFNVDLDVTLCRKVMLTVFFRCLIQVS